MVELNPEQQRLIDGLMEEITADGWEVDPALQEAVYDAFMKGRGEWKDLVIEVRWNHDRPVH